MATQEQKNAVADLHLFNDGTEVQTEYSYSEDGATQAGKTTYDVSHTDPYELYHARKAGAVAEHIVDYVMTVGQHTTAWGYKGTPTTTTPFGSLTPDDFAGAHVFAIEARTSVASVIFTDKYGKTLAPAPSIEVSFDAGTTFYTYNANTTDTSGVKQYDNINDLAAIALAIGTTVDADVTVQIKLTVPAIS